MKCPVCKGRPARVYKCEACNEVRCGQETCTGNMGGPKGFAGIGVLCRSCGEGRYNVLSFFSSEFNSLRRSKDDD